MGGAVMAALVPLLTANALYRGTVFETASPLFSWHGHEMTFGYLAAIISGFVLTAIPNWTGRLPLLGWPLAALFGLWLAGRLSIAVSTVIDPWIVALIDSSFMFVLNAFMWREVIAGKNWRNAPICILIFLFALGNTLWHVDLLHGGAGSVGVRWSLAVAAVLITLIGGRITPSFTHNWLVKNKRLPIEAIFSWFDKVAIAVLSAGLASWFFAPQNIVTGYLLLFASALHILRLLRWKGWRTIAEPTVFILHIGYAWLCAAILLMGASVMAPVTFPATAALHALTAGAIGVMTLAVMTRASLGHTGRPLSANGSTLFIYALINIGAVLRVTAIWAPIDYGAIVALSSLSWSAAFLLFIASYGPSLMRPRIPARLSN